MSVLFRGVIVYILGVKTHASLVGMSVVYTHLSEKMIKNIYLLIAMKRHLSTSYKGEVHDGECTGKGAYFLSDQTKIEGYFKDAILIDPRDERVSLDTQEDTTNNFVLSTEKQKSQTHEEIFNAKKQQRF